MKLSDVLTRTAILALFAVAPLAAQQEAGDKEVGIGGIVDVSHSKPVSGTATGQFSFGRYFTRTQFAGVTLSPNVTFGQGTSVGGFFGANYRYLFGRTNAKVYPFLGAGGGTFLQKGGGSNSAMGSSFGEVGFKAYVSQKTSFEAAYNFLYVNSDSSQGFVGNTRSQILLSIRHLF